jgi:hypothetical protein
MVWILHMRVLQWQWLVEEKLKLREQCELEVRVCTVVQSESRGMLRSSSHVHSPHGCCQ